MPAPNADAYSGSRFVSTHYIRAMLNKCTHFIILLLLDLIHSFSVQRPLLKTFRSLIFTWLHLSYLCSKWLKLLWLLLLLLILRIASFSQEGQHLLGDPRCHLLHREQVVSSLWGLGQNKEQRVSSFNCLLLTRVWGLQGKQLYLDTETTPFELLRK